MSYRLIDANALNGVISNDDYEKVLNAPCIFADLPNGLDGEHYNLQEPSRDIEEIKEVINCDADAETKCKMISNILTAKPHYFEEPFINKPCVSEKVCEHDKQMILDKVRAEISALKSHHINNCYDDGFQGCRTNVLKIIDKYKGEITCQK